MLVAAVQVTVAGLDRFGAKQVHRRLDSQWLVRAICRVDVGIVKGRQCLHEVVADMLPVASISSVALTVHVRLVSVQKRTCAREIEIIPLLSSGVVYSTTIAVRYTPVLADCLMSSVSMVTF